MSKVLVVGGGHSYYRPFIEFGQYTDDHNDIKKKEINLVLFTGGQDISPTLYGHKESVTTYCNSKRDAYELKVFHMALKENLPMAGVCRGAQFLCAMAGGTLFQHVTGHHSYHQMETWDGRLMMVSSTHHQMQNPPEDAVLIGWSSAHLSNIYLIEDDKEADQPEVECECAYYPNINAVGMQYHPEMMHDRSEGFRFAGEIVRKFLFEEVPFAEVA